MYYAHFGLKEPPFRITPNTEVFFSGGNRGAILEALIYALSQGEGIVKVTGEVGSGKTMLCNMLQSRLPEHVETVYLAHPSVSPEDLIVMKAVATDEDTSRYWHDALSLLGRSDLDWTYLVHRARKHGARRVLSLLFFAQSIDLLVPQEVVAELLEAVRPVGSEARG